MDGSSVDSEKAYVERNSFSQPVDNGVDPVTEKKLLWKLDWILLPLATSICEKTLQLFSVTRTDTSPLDSLNFIDRTAIGEQSS